MIDDTPWLFLFYPKVTTGSVPLMGVNLILCANISNPQKPSGFELEFLQWHGCALLSGQDLLRVLNMRNPIVQPNGTAVDLLCHARVVFSISLFIELPLVPIPPGATTPRTPRPSPGHSPDSATTVAKSPTRLDLGAEKHPPFPARK